VRDTNKELEGDGGEDQAHGRQSELDAKVDNVQTDNTNAFGSESVNLRIGAMFATGAVTLLGLSPFFYSAAKTIHQNVLICIRAGSAGTMLSMAVVHILPEATERLENLTHYPLSGVLLLAGIFVGYSLQVLLHDEGESCELEMSEVHASTKKRKPCSSAITAPTTSPPAGCEDIQQPGVDNVVAEGEGDAPLIQQDTEKHHVPSKTTVFFFVSQYKLLSTSTSYSVPDT
jgi:zinc transporter ZupT